MATVFADIDVEIPESSSPLWVEEGSDSLASRWLEKGDTIAEITPLFVQLIRDAGREAEANVVEAVLLAPPEEELIAPADPGELAPEDEHLTAPLAARAAPQTASTVLAELAARYEAFLERLGGDGDRPSPESDDDDHISID